METQPSPSCLWVGPQGPPELIYEPWGQGPRHWLAAWRKLMLAGGSTQEAGPGLPQGRQKP